MLSLLKGTSTYEHNPVKTISTTSPDKHRRDSRRGHVLNSCTQNTEDLLGVWTQRQPRATGGGSYLIDAIAHAEILTVRRNAPLCFQPVSTRCGGAAAAPSEPSAASMAAPALNAGSRSLLTQVERRISQNAGEIQTQPGILWEIWWWIACPPGSMTADD